VNTRTTTLALHWYLPTAGDGRDIVGWAHAALAAGTGIRTTGRAPDLPYLQAVAQAADQLGFASVLTPVGTWCEEPWITTAALITATERLRFIVAVRPDATSPTQIAQMAATFAQLSGGRLALNIVVGSDEAEQHRFGDWADHDGRYRRAAEFLTIVRAAWSGPPVSFDGEFYHVREATVGRPPATPPAIYLGGASESALDVAAQHADVHLSWAEPPDALAHRIKTVREAAELAGRAVSFGVRAHVITRDTAEQAWAQADLLLDAIDDDAIALAQQRIRSSTSVGQRRMADLHGGSRDQLEVSPNLWAGFGLVRRHAGTALVGSHDEVADRLAEYAALGIEHVILSGQPHLEEAYWVAEGLVPRLAQRGLSGPEYNEMADRL
jgi:alkanesulfonate monooxygenase